MQLKTCSKCGKEVNRKLGKKLKSGFFCNGCYEERMEKKREDIKENILGLSKEQELQENRIIKNKEKRKYYIKNIKENNNEVKEIQNIKIKGAKPRKERIRKVSNLGLHLTKDEKQVLYWKYRKKGLCSEEANNCVINDVTFLKGIINKMKESNNGKSEEIQNIFKEEFAKLCERKKMLDLV